MYVGLFLIALVSIVYFSDTSRNASTQEVVKVTDASILTTQAEAISGLGEKLESTAQALNKSASTVYYSNDTSTEVEQTSFEIKILPFNDFIGVIEKMNITVIYVNNETFISTIAMDNKTRRDTIYASRFAPSQVETIYNAAAIKNVDFYNTYKKTAYNAPGNNPYSAANYWTAGTNSTQQAEGTITTVSSTASATGSTNINWWTIIFLLLLGFWVIRLIRGNQQKVGNVRSVNTKENDDGVPQVTFADVAGCDEAIEDMKELVDFLKYPERFAKVNAKPPKGALLVGPPGTGKTLLARAVAGEANVPFYNVAGSDFVEMYVGVGAKRVRDLFKKAKAHKEGAIVFIDEIDAVGRQRGNGMPGSGSNQEQENTLNSLLVELDGFEKTKVIVIGATNREDILDKALMRPGRLDRKIQVPLPDRNGRERILRVHAENKPCDDSVDLTFIAKRTPGMSGADLEQLVNEAAMSAARVDRDYITNADFDNAIATITMGKERKSAIVSDEDRLLTAWHEAGHAMCGLLQEDALKPVSISIVPRGAAGGVTHFPSRDSGYITRRQAYAQLVTAMGGMAAEQMYIGEGEFTTGPSSDLQQASNLALAMITQFGMGESLLVKSDVILSVSNEASDEALQEADELLRQALKDANELLNSHSHIMKNFVEALLEYETLTNEQIQEIMAGHSVVEVNSAPPAPRRESRVREPRAKTQIIYSEPQVVYKDVKPSKKEHASIPELVISLSSAIGRAIRRRRKRLD